LEEYVALTWQDSMSTCHYSKAKLYIINSE